MTKTVADYFETAGRPEFKSEPHYFADGDFVTYFAKSGMHYAQRVDEHVTVYVSEDTGEMIGCKIKSVSRLLDRLGDFCVEVRDHRSEISLGILFLTAATWAEMSKKRTYIELAKALGRASIDLSELAAAA